MKGLRPYSGVISVPIIIKEQKLVILCCHTYLHIIPNNVLLSGGDQCLRNPCGDNAKCRDTQGGFECTCVSGCTGDPYRGCLCQGPPTDLCRDKHCGVHAACRVVNGRDPECYCPSDYPAGNPYIECKKLWILSTNCILVLIWK